MSDATRVAIAQFQERRRRDRRTPLLCGLSFDQADALLCEMRFTGKVELDYAGGVKKEIQIPDPLRIVLGGK